MTPWRAGLRQAEEQPDQFDVLRDRLSQAYADVPVEQGMAEIEMAVIAERRVQKFGRFVAQRDQQER